MPESARSGAWRTLEDASTSPAGDPPGGPASPEARPGLAGGIVARSPWMIGSLGLAAVLGLIAVWLVVAGGRGTLVVAGGGPAAGASGRPGAVPVASGAAAGGELVVDVQGAVVRPGIVRLAGGSRVADAIVAAGGYSPRVAADRLDRVLNLAALVRDGDQVVVPSRDDPAPSAGGGAGGGAAGPGSGPIDLNQATAAQLDSLPGIGPVTAAKIIAAREEQRFVTVDDLRTRKILGEATFAKVKDLVTVG